MSAIAEVKPSSSASSSESNNGDAPVTIGSSSTLTKPGQRYPTPSPGNGDRVFYESLYQQNKASEMAQEWCVAYGILPDDEARELYIQINKRKGRNIGTHIIP